ncbi:MAG: tetratricopeptide repeat protein [Chloroflexi bacterium]|nr:tetratricopeptide repeat protein [Chloroflexota bacterium]
MDLNVSKYQIKEELRKQWTARAVQAALMGKWDEAVQANLQVLQMFPDDIQARNRLGKAYVELGRYEEAVAAYEEALQRQPSNNIARKRLAELYAQLNRKPAVPLEIIPTTELAEEEGEEIEELEEHAEEEEIETGLDFEEDASDF